MPAGRTSLYFDLRDGFRLPGCSICRYALRAVERFFAALTYENTNDPQIRAELRASRGFCNRHTLEYLSWGDELGAAILYRDLLHTIAPAIEGMSGENGLGILNPLTALGNGSKLAESTVRGLAPTHVCLACQRLEASEDDYIDTLLTHLNDEQFAAAFATSDGLCVVHAAMALQRARRAQQTFLRRTQEQIWKEALAKLTEAHRQQDVQLKGVLALAVGGKGVRP